MAVEVGVRELREKLSTWIDRASRGEEIVVTARGRPKARLVPLTTAEEVLARLAREGRVRRPTRPRGVLPPPIPIEGSIMPFLEWARGGPWPEPDQDPAADTSSS
jgi:prevent-host-death family protein